MSRSDRDVTCPPPAPAPVHGTSRRLGPVDHRPTALGVVTRAVVAALIAAPVAGMIAAAGAAEPESDARARATRALIVERLKAHAADGGGTRSLVARLPVEPLVRPTVIEAVLDGNFTVRAAADTVGIAEAVVIQTDAVFDPTVFATLSYTNSFNKDREEDVTRFRNPDPNDDEDQENENEQNGVDTDDQTTVCRVVISEPGGTLPFEVPANDNPECFGSAAPVITTEREKASFESNSQHAVNGTLGTSITFPFGGAASVSVSSQYRKPIATGSGAPALTRPAFPRGTDAQLDPYGWNDSPFWTSNFALSGEMPLPFTKDFGYEGSPDYFNLEVARRDQERSIWVERSTRNTTLAQALISYWDIAGLMEDLRSLIELEDVLARRLASQRRLLEAGLITAYDVEQIETELANQADQEEIAWNFLAVTSNRLATLLGRGEPALLLPTDIGRHAGARHEIDEAAAFSRALEAHPDIKAQEQSTEVSSLTVDFRRNQDRPDITLAASFAVGQTDSAFGYPSLWQSWRNLVRPDSMDIFVGIRYRYPLGMRDTQAALSRARIAERQSFDSLRLVRQRVVNDVDRAVGDVKSSVAILKQSEDNLELARFAYEIAVAQREEGLIPEFQVLNRYRDLLNARRTRTAAEIAYQQAYVAFLGAQGILEQHYGR